MDASLKAGLLAAPIDQRIRMSGGPANADYEAVAKIDGRETVDP